MQRNPYIEGCDAIKAETGFSADTKNFLSCKNFIVDHNKKKRLAMANLF
jgi:hypothetical protein